MDVHPIHNLLSLQLEQATDILRLAYQRLPQGWTNLHAARDEVRTFGESDRHALFAIENDVVVGVIGAIFRSRFLWEVHPVAVHPEQRRSGIGAALMKALEVDAHDQGVCTLWVRTQDGGEGTNLYERELYPGVLSKLIKASPENVHQPYAFLKRLGFEVVGVLPDAKGPGKHEIQMAKRVAPHDTVAP